MGTKITLFAADGFGAVNNITVEDVEPEQVKRDLAVVLRDPNTSYEIGRNNADGSGVILSSALLRSVIIYVNHWTREESINEIPRTGPGGSSRIS